MPLVFVPTPLGNLRDITVRALDTLRDCDLLVAEDTRVAARLLAGLALPRKPMRSYREQNALLVTDTILDAARTGLVAVTTDAGTPAISDPGSQLVAAARAAGVPVEVLPGPCAAIGAIALSGFEAARFTFEGFAPRSSSARRRAFRRALDSGIPSIWYEAPHRFAGALRDLVDEAPTARIFLLREYTKMHEEQRLVTAEDLLASLPDTLRGEIAFVIEPPPRAPNVPPTISQLDAAILELFSQGHSAAQTAKRLSTQGMGERSVIYARAHTLRERETP
ncbi:MAG: 16S rRNA (cytidine(1402)-2'-O)-methyltransferase [Vulcanimicrobiaceae bacterium]